MKATELRIGNFIYGYVEDDEGEEIECLVKVVALDHADITDYRIWVEGFSSKDDHEYYGAFNPIPLTEEWLLKFGFEKPLGQIPGIIEERYNMDRFVIENGISQFTNSGYSFRISTDSQHSTHCASIKYVHQLQNLYFALTGEELTLNSTQ